MRIQPSTEPATAAADEMGTFWAEGFDMDLLSLFPVLAEELRGVESDLWADAPYRLWTFGTTSNGRLNHPSVWNVDEGMVAYFGLDEPDGNGNAGWKPPGRTTTARRVRTFLSDALRDVWLHHYGLVLEGELVFDAQRWLPEFNLLLSVVRGHNRRLEPRDRESIEARVLDHVRGAVARAAEVIRVERARGMRT